MNYYESIPIGKENAISKQTLCELWNMNEREVRRIIQDLRKEDNGDDLVIVSTAKQAGYYRTDNRTEMLDYKDEVSRRARHTFLPLRKVNRIIGKHEQQVSFTNNLKIARLSVGIKGEEVVNEFRKLDHRFDKSLLSKIENGLCMPTPIQLGILSNMYNKSIEELIGASIINAE